MVYSQLTRNQRYQIEAWHRQGVVKREIAQRLGVHRSTVYREFKRNGIKHGGYNARYAWTLASGRRADRWEYGRRKIKGWLEERVLDGLSQRWSPEQIKLRLRLEHGCTISHEAIYRFIYRSISIGADPVIAQALRFARRRRRRRHNLRRHRLAEAFTARRSIEQRPAVINERSRLSDWERDLVIGTQTSSVAILSIVNRHSQYALLRRVESRKADEVHRRTVKAFRDTKLPCESITNDNGFEFSAHKKTEAELGAEIFFAHPYSSYERGTNEQVNGLLRQYLPKGKDFSALTVGQLQEIEDALNHRPRRKLEGRTPYEIQFQKHTKLCLKKRHYRYELKFEDLGNGVC